jgi:hypothetical protein
VPTDTAQNPIIDKVRNDPEFYSLPADAQRHVWGTLDPEFKSLPLSDQDYVLRQLQSDYSTRSSARSALLKKQGYKPEQVEMLISGRDKNARPVAPGAKPSAGPAPAQPVAAHAPYIPPPPPVSSEQPFRIGMGAEVPVLEQTSQAVRRDQPMIPASEAVASAGKLPDYATTPLKAVVGMGGGLADIVSTLSKPSNLGLLAGAMMTPWTSIPRIIKILTSLGFSYVNAKGAAEDFVKAYQAYERGDTQELSRYGTAGLVQALFSYKAASGAGKTTKEAVEAAKRGGGGGGGKSPTTPPGGTTPILDDIVAQEEARLRSDIDKLKPEDRLPGINNIIDQTQKQLDAAGKSLAAAKYRATLQAAKAIADQLLKTPGQLNPKGAAGKGAAGGGGGGAAPKAEETPEKKIEFVEGPNGTLQIVEVEVKPETEGAKTPPGAPPPTTKTPVQEFDLQTLAGRQQFFNLPPAQAAKLPDKFWKEWVKGQVPGHPAIAAATKLREEAKKPAGPAGPPPGEATPEAITAEKLRISTLLDPQAETKDSIAQVQAISKQALTDMENARAKGDFEAMAKHQATGKAAIEVIKSLQTPAGRRKRGEKPKTEAPAPATTPTPETKPTTPAAEAPRGQISTQPPEVPPTPIPEPAPAPPEAPPERRGKGRPDIEGMADPDLQAFVTGLTQRQRVGPALTPREEAMLAQGKAELDKREKAAPPEAPGIVSLRENSKKHVDDLAKEGTVIPSNIIVDSVWGRDKNGKWSLRVFDESSDPTFGRALPIEVGPGDDVAEIVKAAQEKQPKAPSPAPSAGPALAPPVSPEPPGVSPKPPSVSGGGGTVSPLADTSSEQELPAHIPEGLPPTGPAATSVETKDSLAPFGVDVEVKFPPSQETRGGLAKASRNPILKKQFKRLGITGFSIEEPYKFDLSEQGNIERGTGVIRLNAIADDPEQTLAHELAHDIYERLDPVVQARMRDYIESNHIEAQHAGGMEERIADYFADVMTGKVVAPSGIADTFLSSPLRPRDKKSKPQREVATPEPIPVVRSWDEIRKGGGFITESDDLAAITKKYGEQPIVIKDVNGWRSILPSSAAAKLLSTSAAGYVRAVFIPAATNIDPKTVEIDTSIPEFGKALKEAAKALPAHPGQGALYSGFAALENLKPRETVSNIIKQGVTATEYTIRIGKMGAQAVKQAFDIDKYLKYKGEFGGDVVAAFRRLAAARSYARFYRPFWEFFGGGNKLTEEELDLTGRYFLSLRKAEMNERGIPANAIPELSPEDLVKVQSNKAIQKFIKFYVDSIYPMVEQDHMEAGVEWMSKAEIYFPIVRRRVSEDGEIAYAPLLMPFGLPKTGFARKAMGEDLGPGWELVTNPLEAIEAAAQRTSHLAAQRNLASTLKGSGRALVSHQVVRLSHAIASKDPGSVQRAMKEMGLTKEKAQKISHLVQRGHGSPAEIAEALLGGSTVQVWFGTPIDDSNRIIDGHKVKIGWIKLGREMRDISHMENVSPELAEKLKADAYERFFEEYGPNLRKLVAEEPEEIQHFVRAPLGREYVDLIYPKWQTSHDTALKALKGDAKALQEMRSADVMAFLWSNIRNVAVGARLASPSAIIWHTNRLLGLSLPIVAANSPKVAQKAAAVIPLLNRFNALYRMKGIAKTKEGIEMSKRLARIGALRPEAFEQKSVDAFRRIFQAFDTALGRTVAGIAGGVMGSAYGGGGAIAGAALGTMAPHILEWLVKILDVPRQWIFGFEGLDMDARVYAGLFVDWWYRTHDGKPATDDELATFAMQNYGNYISAMQTNAVKFLRETGALPWASFHAGAIPTELAHSIGGSLRIPKRPAPPGLPPFSGGGGIPNEPPPRIPSGPGVNQKWWQRIETWWVATLGSLLAAAVLNKLLNGKWSHEEDEGQQFKIHIPVGDQLLVVDDSFLAPETMRPFRISGEKALTERIMEGERDPDAYISSTMRDWVNFTLQESAQSPIWKPGFIFAFGKEPYLRQDWSLGSAGVDTGDPLPPRAHAKAALINTWPLLQSAFPRGYSKVQDFYLQAILDQFGQSGRLVDMEDNDRNVQFGKVAAVREMAKGVAQEMFHLPNDQRRAQYDERLSHVHADLRPAFSREVAKMLGALFYGLAEDTNETDLDAKIASRESYGLFRRLARYEKDSESIRNDKALTHQQKQQKYRENDDKMQRDMDLFFKQTEGLRAPEPPPTGGNPFNDLMHRLGIGPPEGRM